MSSVGLKKAQNLAKAAGVEITTVHANLTEFEIGTDRWDGIVSIFCHMPPKLRVDVHRHCVAGLRPGEAMLIEAYTPRQLEFGTGGPGTVEMMMDAEGLKQELAPFGFSKLRECERNIHEGKFHNGHAAVVQAAAKKPNRGGAKPFLE